MAILPDLMGKYDGRRNKKGTGGHCRRYRDNNKIKALHGLYKEPTDDNDDDNSRDDDDGD